VVHGAVVERLRRTEVGRLLGEIDLDLEQRRTERSKVEARDGHRLLEHDPAYDLVAVGSRERAQVRVVAQVVRQQLSQIQRATGNRACERLSELVREPSLSLARARARPDGKNVRHGGIGTRLLNQRKLGNDGSKGIRRKNSNLWL